MSESPAVSLPGKYRLEHNDNMDEYFKTVGIPYIPRKLMLTLSPEMEVSVEDDNWTISTSSIMRTNKSSFKLGEEYTETMPSGDLIKNVTTMESDTKLVTIMKSEKGDTEKTMEFSKEGVLMILKHSNGVEGKRYFRRLQS